MTPFERLQLVEAQCKLDFGYDEKVLAAASLADRSKATMEFAKFRKARLSGQTLNSLEGKVASLPIVASAASAPAPAADVVGDVLKQLESCLQQLKSLHPDVVNADDADADETQAREAMSRGDKATALRCLDTAISKMGARIAAKNASSGLRSQPSSRQRASALIRGGFSAQAGVAKIQSCLHGPHPGPAVPTSLAVPAAAPAAAGNRDRVRVQEILAARKMIDLEYRKTGIFSPEAQAQDAALLREYRSIHSRFSHKQ